MIDLMLEKRLGVMPMAGVKRLRKRLFVDPNVQGTLIIRVILYWIVCLLTIAMMLMCWRIVTGPARGVVWQVNDVWYQFGPAFVASFLLLPMVIIDIIRVSNRFAGPMIRLRRAMRDVAEGRSTRPIRFRDDDFWQDFAGEFNAVLYRVQELEAQLAAARHCDAEIPVAPPKDDAPTDSEQPAEAASSQGN
ncbi:MAG: hypothetical protein D6741_06885 [Planctomycetota bacterium]|nr:MAG: hypothetical protein D6741_06885 [Planctomycetota bacterium]